MEVRNDHVRTLEADPIRIGALIDSLSSKEDRLWPRQSWPPMKFDAPLGIGAAGGHGPIRYSVEEYTPGKTITFRFTGPKGFDGFHRYELAGTQDTPVLRHTLSMKTHGSALFSWPLVFRPMHDALIEDSLAMAQASLGLAPQVRPWSFWVKVLRWLFSGGKARPQVTPTRLLHAMCENPRV
jgi:hypothetical protein